MKFSKEQVEILLEAIYEGSVDPTKLPKDLYESIGMYLEDGMRRPFSKMLADGMSNRDIELYNKLRENTWMFSAAKTHQQVKDIQSLMYDKDGKLVGHKEFNKLGAEAFDKWNKVWGATEYNTAVGQATTAIHWETIQAQKELFPFLKYKTIGDACKICGPLDGFTARVDDKAWSKIMPLNHFNCLCIVEQVDGTAKATLKEEKEQLIKEVTDLMHPVFKMNPGVDKIIFSHEHPYFKVDNEYKELAKENFKLPLPKPIKLAKAEKVTKADTLETIQQKVYNLATNAEKKAVDAYTGSTYSTMNGILRGTVSPEGWGDSGVLDTIDTLHNFLIKAPKYRGETYRGLKFYDENEYAKFMSTISDGGIFEDKGFMSSTTDINKVFSKNRNYAAELTIKGKNGVPIAKLSGIEEEAEVLFTKGSQFKIESFKEEVLESGGKKLLINVIEL